MTTTQHNWEITEATRKAIDALFTQCTNSTPGAAIAIYRDGEVVYANGYGIANLEHNIPITPSTIFDIASISKQFTAMCIALLQQEGLLDIDDPIQKYIPELPEWDHPVTVRHLIHHVSGLRDYLGILPLAGWREEDQMTNGDCLKYISKQKTLEFEPNTKYSYSNSGYVLLAILVERVSGTPMSQFARERVLTPLGMTHSHFNDDHATVIPNRAQAYRVDEDGTYRLDMMPLDDLVGDGGLFTSVIDFGKWVSNFNSGLVGGKELLKQIQTPGTFQDGTPMTYAWGLTVENYHGHQRVGHSGGWAGYRSNYFRLPELAFAVAIFTNVPRIEPGRLSEKIAEIVLEDVLKTGESAEEEENSFSPFEEIEIVGTEPQHLAGVYISDDGGDHLIIDLKHGEPFITYWWADVALTRNDDGSYASPWGMFALAPIAIDADDAIVSLIVYLKREDRYITLKAIAPPTNIAHDEYTGRYYSNELDTFWDVTIMDDGSTLNISRARSEDNPYRAIAPDHFGTGGLLVGVCVRFRRNQSGHVTGFIYSTGRLDRIDFERQ